jgi:hypothetical protein
MLVANSRRLGFSFLELQVAFVVFAFTLAGLYPLVLMQSKQLRKIEGWLNPQNTYYLVPSTDEWVRKLGAVSSIQTQDPGPRPPAPVMDIDNGETGYSEAGNGWGAETQKKAYKENLRWHTAGTGSDTATWQFTGLQPGWYEVQVTWLESGNRATNSPYKIYNGSTLKGTYLVNQKVAPSGPVFDGRPWQSLAVVPISSGTAEVELNDYANNRVVADGVRLIAKFNTVQILSLDRTLTSEEVTAQVAVTVVVP